MQLGMLQCSVVSEGIARSRNATSPSFEELAREHGPALHRVALRLCRGPSDAQDLVQDTLERALRHFQDGVREENLKAWLLTILRHRFVDQCRRRGREVPAPENAPEPVAVEPEPEPAWAAITTEQVREALQRIPQEFRTVYELHAIERRSYADIAETLRIPKATVGTRLIRARRKLKAILMPDTGEETEEPASPATGGSRRRTHPTEDA
jgi:RNA polymerase sigma-70 factor, ECF subfamily